MIIISIPESLRGKFIPNYRTHSFDVQWNKSLSHLTCCQHVLHRVCFSTLLETSRQFQLPLVTHSASLRSSWHSVTPFHHHLLNFKTFPSFIQDLGKQDCTLPLAFVLGDVSFWLPSLSASPPPQQPSPSFFSAPSQLHPGPHPHCDCMASKATKSNLSSYLN